ncbi:MAG: IclR family transcriptional regulator [Gaiellales bacterium]
MIGEPVGRSAPALSSGLAVLRLLAAATGPVPATVIARELGLPRSTTYRLLQVLAGSGFVTHFPEDRAYGLGVAAFEVGTAFLRQDRLERLGRPVLARLAASTRATAHLGILLGREVLYLLKEQPVRPVPLITDVGVRLPAHLTASGRALLAALPPVEFRAIYPTAAVLAERTDTGPRTVAALRRLVDDERAAGISVEDGHVTAGIASVAVAATDRAGRPVAAISLSLPSDELPAREEALTTALQRANRTLSRRLGAR